MSQVKIVKIQNYKEDLRKIFSDLNFKIEAGEKILIKPNLVMPRSADSGVTTNLELISALIEIIKENRAKPILGEGVGYEFDSQTFSILGINKLVKKYQISFVDFRNCQTFFKKIQGQIFRKIELPKILEEVDKIINLPKLKTHILTGISCGLKNLMGILPLSERRKMHIRGLHRSIVELNSIIPTDLTIVDASVIMHGQGPAFGDKIELGYLLAGTNVFITDFAATQLLEKISAAIPKNRFYILLYWLLYFFDYCQAKITKRTLIPWIHWHFGARPKLDIKRCHLFPQCQECIKVCPVKAISKREGINYKKCAKIRCLKCFEICPNQAIFIKGMSKPSIKKQDG